jgi:hypothetical protein
MSRKKADIIDLSTFSNCSRIFFQSFENKDLERGFSPQTFAFKVSKE